MKSFLIVSFLGVSYASFDNCFKCDADQSSIHGRLKREIDKYVYPMIGTWHKDSHSGKYYFKQGNSIYVQRNDGYYSKWVSTGNGVEYILNDKLKWTWDRYGRIYSLEDDCPDPIKQNQKFGIPINCLGGQCPDQVKFPSGGMWHNSNGKYYYQIDDTIYQLCCNGFYSKWTRRPPMNEAIQICPDNWTFDTHTGEWEPVPNSERKICTYDEIHDGSFNSKLIAKSTPSLPEDAFLL